MAVLITKKRKKDDRNRTTLILKIGGGGSKPEPVIDYSKEYFFIEDVSGEENEVKIYSQYDGWGSSILKPFDLYYSYDKENWILVGRLYVNSGKTDIWTLPLSANQKIYFKSENQGFSWQGTKCTIRCNKIFNAGGNVMSLTWGNDFIDKTYFRGYGFSNLFSSMISYTMYKNNLVDVSKLVIPATTLTDSCYSTMFYGCDNITTAPALPATELAESCYNKMFYGCKSLTEAPELPVTELKDWCYYGMFADCASLTTAPALPATEMKEQCYGGMFARCTSLTEAPILLAKIVNTANNGCYSSMFSGCTKLNKVITYAENFPANGMYEWLYNVSKTGDFYNFGGSTYPRNYNGIPTGWTEHKASTQKFIRVTIDEEYAEYPMDSAYVRLDGSEPYYLTEPLYLDVTNVTSITGDTGSKRYSFDVNGMAIGTRYLNITTDELHEGDNDIVLTNFG